MERRGVRCRANNEEKMATYASKYRLTMEFALRPFPKMFRITIGAHPYIAHV